MISKRDARKLAVLVFMGTSGCKLLHHEIASDAGTTTASSSSSTVAATEPDLGGVPTTTIDDANALAVADDASVDADTDASLDPRVLAHQQALREAAEFGMLGLLGEDAVLDGGNMIGLGNIGTIGSGTSGHSLGTRPGHAPSLRMGALTVNGRLPPEVIKRIIRQNLGRFRLCYENGLRLNPSLQGRVMTKFVIVRDGSVSTAADGGSDMPDTNVVNCVIRAHSNLSFPQPEGGIVTVASPIIFSPSS